MATFIHHMVRCFLLLALLIFAPATFGQGHAAELGDEITNIAQLGFTDSGRRVTIATNRATFVVEAYPTESTIEFFRYAPSAPGAQGTQINGSDYSPDGSLQGPFTTIGPALNVGGQTIDLSGPVPLTPADMYLSGEMMFISVVDRGQNGNPNRIETVTITVRATTGDEITLRLYESGPDTGEFWGYVPSVREQTPVNDTRLTTGQETRLTATYVDTFDDTEVSIDTALVDPYGRVFNSVSGELIDGVRVRIVDAVTGDPAQVFGIDGVSIYPNSLVTGSRVMDSGGLIYDLEPGEFRFPLMAPGSYRVVVEPPEGLTAPSSRVAGDFVGLINAPFEISPASYGNPFEVTAFGPVNFDVPLDPESDLVLAKTAEPSIGDVGDFIRYTVTLANKGRQTVPAILKDLAPSGFRYVTGTSRVGDGLNEPRSVPDPEISGDGREHRYNLGTIEPGATIELSYVLQIGAGVKPGESVNEVVGIGANDVEITNIARAPVTIREELFRTKTTIIGRITENSCDEDEDWARELRDGTGIEGVRVYLETGQYAVTDQDGLYHFEAIEEGTHVVQVDKETLPDGFEPMICEENSRYANRAMSKFVDVKGGNIWRANFYLKRVKAVSDDDEETAFNDLTEYKRFDRAWLTTQTAEIDWIYPDASRTPSQPSVNIGIKHGPDHRVTLTLDDRPVPLENFQARDSNNEATVYLTRWRGIDLKEGRNRFVATVKDASGQTAATLTRDIWFIDDVARAIPVDDRSILVADGRTTPVIAVRMEDKAGRPVHSGRLVTVEAASPYRLKAADQRERSNELAAPLSGSASVSVGADGVALIELEPTLKTGQVTLLVDLDDGRKVLVKAYLKPEKRDWIIVGLAEGTIGYDTIRRKGTGGGDKNDVFTDGRIAFFAKGLIKGEWLLTLAVDTDKRRADQDGDFEEEIDPDAYYTLYGDRTYQENEAPSRYPVYVKLEKNQFYAMFGDYDTNIDDSKLTRYTRRLSGVKSEYVGENFRVVAFGAETNQGFVKDEIPADGTTGSYRLSNAPILADSETITIETRNRFRPDIVVDRRLLVRHIDYTLDTNTGELIFRLPVPVSDAALNPNVIVADYETRGDAERNFTYGARAAGDLFSGAVTVGATYIHEGGSSAAAESEADLGGIDFVARIGKSFEARAELARSRKTKEERKADAVAWLAELAYRKENLTAEAYVRHEEEDFGVDQQSSATSGVRRIGGRANYQLDAETDEETGRVTTRSVSADAYHEKNLRTGSTRVVGEAKVSQDNERWGVSSGLRHVQDEDADGKTRRSTLATVGGRLSLPDHRAVLTAAHEQPLGGNNDVNAFPQRTTIGVTKTVNEWADVTLTHEYRRGQELRAHISAIGFKLKPWTGADVTLGNDFQTADSARRLGGTVGLDQQFKIDDNWTASAGFTHHRVLQESGVMDVAPDAAESPIETGETYTVAHAGVGYRTEVTSGSARLEGRRSDLDTTYTVSSSAARDLSEEFSVAGDARMQRTEYHDGLGGEASRRFDMKLGFAWRPRDEGPAALNRLDLKYEKTRNGETTSKIINNFAANARIGRRGQIAGHYGVKYVMTEYNGVSHSGWTHLLGAEARYDVTKIIDLGLHGSILYSPGTETKQYAWGPSIGVKPIDNVWVSLGYNFQGFDDDDFEAARFTRDGIYAKLRVKFDEDTARGILDFISPEAK